MKLLRFMLLSLGVALFASVQAQTSPTLRLEPYANPLVVPNYTKGATYYFDLMKTDGTYGDAFVELKYLIEYSPNTAVSGWDTIGRIFDEYGGMIVESKLHMGLSTFSSHDTLHAWSGSFPTYIGLDGYSRLIRLSALDTATLLSIHFDKPGFYRVSYMFEQYSCPSAAPYEVVTSKNGAVSMGLISYHMTLFHIQDSILPSAEVTPALPAVLSTGYQHRVGVRMDAGSYQYHHYTVPAYILYSVKKQNPATMEYEPISISDFGSFSLNYHGSAVAGDSAGRLPSGANTAVLLDSVHNDTLDFDFLCKIGQGGLYQVQVQMYQYDTNRYHFMDHDTVRHGLLMDTCFYLNFAEVPEKLLRLSPCDRPDTVINYTKGGTYYFDLLKRNSIFGNEMVEMRYVMEYSSDGTTWSNTGLVFDDYGGMITTSTLNTVMGSFSERDTLHDWTGAFPSYVGVDGYTRLIRLNALDTASLVTMRFDKFGHYRVVYQLHRYTVPGLMPYDVVASKNGATWGSLISSDTTVFHIQDSILPTGELTPAQPAVVSTGYPHTVGVRIDAGSYQYPHYTVPAYLRYNVKKQNPSTMAYEPVSISDFGSFSLNFHGYSTVDSAGRLPSGATNYVMLNTLHNDTMKFDLQCTPGKGGWYQINVQLYQYDTNRYSMDTVHHGMLMDTSYYLYFDELPEKLLWLHPTERPDTMINYTKGGIYFFDLMKRNSIFGEEMVELRYIMEYSHDSVSWTNTGMVFDEYGGMITTSRLHVGMGVVTEDDTLHDWTGSFPTSLGIDGYPRLIRLKALDTGSLVTLRFEKGGYYRVVYQFHRYTVPGLASWDVVVSKNGTTWKSLISSDTTVFHVMDSLLPSCEMTSTLPSVLGTGSVQKVKVRLDAGSYQYHHYTIPSYIYYNVKRLNPATSLYEPAVLDSFSLSFHGYSTVDSAGRLPAGATSYMMLDSIHNDTLYFDLQCPPGQGGMYQINIQLYQYDTNRYQYNMDTVRHGLLLDSSYYLFFDELPDKLLQLKPYNRPDTVVNYTKGATYYFDLMKRNGFFGNDMMELRYEIEYSTDGTTWSNTGMVFDDYGEMISTSTLNTIVGSFSQCDTVHNWTGVFPAYVGVDGYTRLIRLGALDTGSLLTMRFDKAGYYRVVYQFHRYTVPGLMPYDVFVSKNGATWRSLASSDTTLFHVKDSILPSAEVTPALPAILSVGQSHQVGIRIDAGSYQHSNYTAPAYLEYTLSKYDSTLSQYVQINSIGTFGSFAMSYKNDTVSAGGEARLPLGPRSYVMLDSLHNDTLKLDFLCLPTQKGWYAMNVRLMQYDTNRYHYTDRDTVRHATLMDTVYYMYFNELKKPTLKIDPKPCSVEVPTEVTQQYNLVVNAKEYVDSSATIVCTIKYNGTEISDWSNYLDTTYVTLNDSVCLIDPTTKRMLYNVPLTRLENSSIKHFINFRVAGNYTMAYSMYVNNNLATTVVLTYVCSDTLMLSPGDKVHPSAQSTLRAEAYPLGVQDTFNVYVHAAEYENTYTQIALKLFYSQDSGQTLIPIDSVNVFGSAKVRMDANAIGYTGMADERVFTTHRDTVHPMYIYRLGAVAGVPFEFISRWDSAGTYVYTYEILQWDCFDADSLETMTYMHSPIYGRVSKTGGRPKAVLYRDTLMMHVYPQYLNEKDSIELCASNLPHEYNGTGYCVSASLGTAISGGPITTTARDTLIIPLKTIHGMDSIIHLAVQVHPSHVTYFKDTLRGVGAYSNHGFNEVFNMPGRYVLSQTLTNTFGCDSVVTDSLVVVPTHLFEDSVTICSSELPYTWRGRTLSAANTYYDSLKTAIYAADSVYKMILKVNPSYTVGDDVVLCANALPYNYKNTGNYIAMTSRLLADLNQGQTGRDTFTFVFPTVLGCDSVVTVAVEVNPLYRTVFYDTLRGLGAYSNHGFNEVFNMPGRYVLSQTLASVAGCDSVVIDSLVVVPTYLFEDSVTICSSELPYTWRGRTLSAANTYYDSLKTAIYAADSVYKMILKVNPSYAVGDDVVLCANALPYNYNNTGNYITMTSRLLTDLNLGRTGRDTFTFVFPTVLGCDSVVTVAVEVNPLRKTVFHDTLRGVGTYNRHDFYKVFDMPGRYVLSQTFASVAGCDSVVIDTIIVAPAYLLEDSVTICSDELPYMWRGRLWPSAGVCYDSLKTAIYKADSVYKMTINVNPAYLHQVDSVILCVSQLPYNYKGTGQFITETPAIRLATMSGTDGRDTFKIRYRTVNGCDSIVYVSALIHPAFVTDLMDTACVGVYSHAGFSNYFRAPGIYRLTRTETSVYGCDSVINLSVYVAPNYYTKVEEAICAGEPYMSHGFSFVKDVPGTYAIRFNGKTSCGCDSIIDVMLTVYPSYSNPASWTRLKASVCRGETYSQNGFYVETYKLPTNKNVHNDTNMYRTVNGCDSVVHLQLTIHDTVVTRFAASICLGSRYSLNGFNVQPSAAGVYEFRNSRRTAHGCDSTAILTLTVNQVYNVTYYDEICEGERYTKYGFNDIVTVSGTRLTHNYNAQRPSGCDSIVTVVVTVHPKASTSYTDYVCRNEGFYNKYGFHIVIPSAINNAVYRDTLRGKYGCDSIVTLYLTIYDAKDTSITASVCEGERYHSYGFDTTIYVPGTYHFKHVLTASNSCDSNVTLTLVVKPTYTSYETVTICQEDSVMYNGVKYGVGTHKISYPHSAACCDSILWLTVNANPIVRETVDVRLCRNTQPNYLFNDKLLTATGTYYDTIPFNGCYKIVTLNLTFLDTATRPTSISGPINIYTAGVYNYTCDTVPYNVNAGIPAVDSYRWETTDTTWTIVSAYMNTANINIPKPGSGYIFVSSHNECGYSSRTPLKVFAKVSVADAGADNAELTIFPNPTNAEYSLRINGMEGRVQISIVDMTGRIVAREEAEVSSMDNTFRYNAENYPKGVYMITVQQGDKKVMKKLSVQ